MSHLPIASEPLDTVEAIVARARYGTHEPTRPVDSPGAEPTSEDLERLGEGELESLVIAGRYRVERLLGRGGMATVYAAHDLTLDLPIALKVLSDDYSGRPRILARFLREARLNARLRHPKVVELLDFGSTRTGVVYLAMELLGGEDLRETLARERTLPWPRVRALMLDICAGLAAAHAAGIVHRDLKPSNCFRVTSGTSESIRLVDFGIATYVKAAAAESGSRERRRLTLENRVVGTPEYMSPEQARGEQVDHRSDIYSAALILGEMLTGCLPFSATTPAAMLAAQIYERPVRLGELAPRGVRIPPQIVAVQARALAKDPDDRYPDIETFAAALREVGPEASGRSWFDLGVLRRVRRAGNTHPWLSAAAAASVAFTLGIAGGLSFVQEPAPAAFETQPSAESAPLVSSQAARPSLAPARRGALEFGDAAKQGLASERGPRERGRAASAVLAEVRPSSVEPEPEPVAARQLSAPRQGALPRPEPIDEIPLEPVEPVEPVEPAPEAAEAGPAGDRPGPRMLDPEHGGPGEFGPALRLDPTPNEPPALLDPDSLPRGSA